MPLTAAAHGLRSEAIYALRSTQLLSLAYSEIRLKAYAIHARFNGINQCFRVATKTIFQA